MNIVFLDGYTLQTSNDATMLKRLEAYGNLMVYDRTSNDEIVERAKDADLLAAIKAVDKRVHREFDSKSSRYVHSYVLDEQGVSGRDFNIAVLLRLPRLRRRKA